MHNQFWKMEGEYEEGFLNGDWVKNYRANIEESFDEMYSY